MQGRRSFDHCPGIERRETDREKEKAAEIPLAVRAADTVHYY